jgi:hypothetical protein
MPDNLIFKRAYLAQAYCDSLAGKGIRNATSGLFLAGPRRAGKSMFLLEDLNLFPAACRGTLRLGFPKGS